MNAQHIHSKKTQNMVSSPSDTLQNTSHHLLSKLVKPNKMYTLLLKHIRFPTKPNASSPSKCKNHIPNKVHSLIAKPCTSSPHKALIIITYPLPRIEVDNFGHLEKNSSRLHIHHPEVRLPVSILIQDSHTGHSWNMTMAIKVMPRVMQLYPMISLWSPFAFVVNQNAANMKLKLVWLSRSLPLSPSIHLISEGSILQFPCCFSENPSLL